MASIPLRTTLGDAKNTLARICKERYPDVQGEVIGFKWGEIPIKTDAEMDVLQHGDELVVLIA